MTIRIAERRYTTTGNRFSLNDFHRKVLADICVYINNHLTDDLSGATLAARAGYSRAHFGRMFRMMHGTSIKTYVTERRLTVAIELLRDTDLTIDAIAQRVGYDSKGGLVKVFVARLGHTPTRYRGYARAAAKRAAARTDEEATS